MKQLNFITRGIILIAAIYWSNNDILIVDPMVGIRKPIKEVGFARDGTPETFENTLCEQTSRNTLTADGHFTYSEFHDEISALSKLKTLEMEGNDLVSISTQIGN